MRISDVLQQLLPNSYSVRTNTRGRTSLQYKAPQCPTWPPDIFAIVGTIIDRSGCYTEYSSRLDSIIEHETYLAEVESIANSWKFKSPVPAKIARLWEDLTKIYHAFELDNIKNSKPVLDTLLILFAVADEVCKGMGWEKDKCSTTPAWNDFAKAVLENSVELESSKKLSLKLPYWPKSLCYDISPDKVIVLPKSITADKGCTIRSLSHHLALIPSHTKLEPEWRMVSKENADETELRLLLIPFPYTIPDGSFELAKRRENLNNKTTRAASFKLNQKWLETNAGTRLTGEILAEKLVLPLILNAASKTADKKFPHGVIFPECALDEQTTIELVNVLKKIGIEFIVTGVLEQNKTHRWVNRAYTLFVDNMTGAPQSKHHRWRVDKAQADSYNLAFDGDDPDNEQWWEEIDVTERRLPFFALRKDMSMVTLICEDLARMEPAMTAIRAVGPNLVVALLMDGPQIGSRWPGRYGGVLADEPGCSVLSLTCSATVDLSNQHFKSRNPTVNPQRVIARWTDRKRGSGLDIEMDDNANGVVITLTSMQRHQTTLDNRSDQSQSRELLYQSHMSIFAGERLT